jgi:uncharacterized protein
MSEARFDEAGPADEPAGELALADWRRQTAELYAGVRHAPTPPDGHALWRAGRDRMFRGHPQSPLGAADALRDSGLPYWPYDPQWRFAVALVGEQESVSYEVPTDPEEITRIRQIGWVQLPDSIGGRLAVWWLEQYGGGVFVPFRDATAGSSTYGAGRYLLDTAKGADLGLDGQLLVLDFNFSYHPSCRYDPAWQCPLAPPQNVLAVAIEAGERL